MDWHEIYKKGREILFAERKAESRTGLIGLDIGSETIIGVEVVPSKTRPILREFAVVDTPQVSKEIGDAIGKIFESKKFSSRRVHIGIGGPSVIVRYISLPYMTTKELKSSIAYEAEKYIPFKTDDVYIDFHVLSETQTAGGKKRINILLVAAKKDKVQEIAEVIRDAGVEIEAVQASAVALINAFQWAQPDAAGERICQADFGAHYITVNIIDEGTPVFTRDVSFGGEDVASALAKQLNVGVDEALRIMKNFDWNNVAWKEAIAKPFSHLASEVRLSINYFEHQLNESKNIQKTFIHGGVTKITNFQQVLQRELGYPVQYADPLSKLDFNGNVDKELASKYAKQMMVALGLALPPGES